jgi:hypothetical protein
MLNNKSLKTPKDRQYNGHKRDKNTNTNRQNYAKKNNDLATRSHK